MRTCQTWQSTSAPVLLAPATPRSSAPTCANSRSGHAKPGRVQSVVLKSHLCIHEVSGTAAWLHDMYADVKDAVACFRSLFKADKEICPALAAQSCQQVSNFCLAISGRQWCRCQSLAGQEVYRGSPARSLACWVQLVPAIYRSSLVSSMLAHDLCVDSALCLKTVRLVQRLFAPQSEATPQLFCLRLSRMHMCSPTAAFRKTSKKLEMYCSERTFTA